MKHVILMTVYKDIKLVNQLIDTTPSNFDFFIHIDKKSKISNKDISARAHIYKVYKVYWGGIEHLKSFLFLMKEALKYATYDFYHLITGQDFFCIPFDKVDCIFEKKYIYIDSFALPKEKWWGRGGENILQTKTLSSFGDVRKPYIKELNSLIGLVQKLFHLESSLPEYPLYGGSVYCSLPDYVVEECLYGNIAKDLLKRLQNTTCGEEIFFQTVLNNSIFKNRIINNNLRYIDWSVPKGPRVLEEGDFDKIIKANKIFCRKIDLSYSMGLLRKLSLYCTTIEKER